MKKVSLMGAALLLSGCSFNAIEMAPEPTQQVYDLADPESDGVITARDNCLDTINGAEITNDGCGASTLEVIRVKLLVNFANDSAVIENKYKAEIEELADFMVAYPSITLVVEGHTSIVGSAEYNKDLSLRRAEAVKQLLVKQYGVSEERVQTKGFGFEKPLLEGNDEYVNAQNRRIVAEVTGEKEFIEMKWTIYSVDQQN